MTVNKLERAYITSDCHKIFDQIEMGGPDCKIFLDAINMQYEEAGDGCKLLILFGCELISELKALVAQVILNSLFFSQSDKSVRRPGSKNFYCGKILYINYTGR